MKKEDIEFLNQLIKSLEEAGRKLKESYEEKDSDMFIKSKKFILQIQRKISEVSR